MANQIRIRASVDDKASGPIDNLRDKFEKLRTGGGKGFAIGAGAAVTAFGIGMLGNAAQSAVQYLGDAVNAASDLNEEIDKSSVVFGSAAPKVQAFADGATAIGLSKAEALGAAGAFGNMFRTTGLASGAAADMSINMVKLASDMASFNNEDPAEMLDRLRSGLSGEAEPLRRFGVLLSEASVKAFAYSSGIAAAGAQLTEAQKVQARYGLILEQTAIQQGNFALTSEGLANTQRELSAKLENASAKVGQLMLPMFAKLAGFLADVVVPGFERLIDLIGFLTSPIGLLADAIGWMVDDSAIALEKLPKAVESAGLKTSEAAWETMQGVLSAATEGGQQVVKEWERIAAAPANIMSRQLGPIRDAAFQSQVAYAKGLIDGQNQPVVQMEALAQLQEESLTRSAEVARLWGQLNSEELAAGMADSRGAVNAQAQATRLAIINQLATLGVDASTWGYGIGASLASGLDQGYGVVVTAAGKLAGAVRGQIGINSEPSDSSSPLRGITKWGGNIAKELSKGMLGGATGTRRAAGGLAGSVGGGGGGGVVIQLQLDGRTVAEVVDRQLYYQQRR